MTGGKWTIDNFQFPMASSLRAAIVNWKLSIANCQLMVVLCLCFPGVARAELDPELDKPYRLQVVVHVADNRFLTPIFREQLLAGLRDQLQLALGPLALVETTSTHPLLAEIEARGLENALDGWEGLSGLKTHFVLVDFAAGVYSIKARQHDGMTGLQSPVVRAAQIADRSLVARAAAQLVLQDFGLVGTVISAEKEVQLALKAGKLGGNLERLVKPGDVFAISRITDEGGKLHGSRLSRALLEVMDTPKGGVCRCRLWHRYQEDDLRDRPGVMGYRCLKLTTTSGPLKLRLIDDDQFQPLAGVQVHVWRPGSAKAAELTTNQSGLAVTRESYPHFALVRVLGSAQFPVEITSDRIVVCRLKMQPDSEVLAPLLLRKDQWLRRILDDLRLASERVGDLNSQLSSRSLDKALEAARTGLESMVSEINYLTVERDDILRQASAKAAQMDLRQGEIALESLRRKKQDLERFVSRIESVRKEATSAATLGLAKMLERARLFEEQADFDQAIDLYKKVLEASPDQPKVKDHLAKLRTDWALKNARHAEARAFLTKVWPGLAVHELAKNLDKAKEALSTCRDAHDHLTPLKVVQSNAIHAAHLQKQLQALKNQTNADNPAQARQIVQVIDGLRRLHKDATDAAEKGNQ
jgi:tetratricopeptide (TPR) repeat protein